MRPIFLVLLGLLTVLATACAAPAGSLAAAQLLPFGEAIPGRLLFVKDGNLWLWSDGRARQLTSGESWRQPSWSPDGQEIAYVYLSTNFSELFAMNADGSDTRRLTRSQSSSLAQNDWVFRPTWSPGGDQIAYVTDSATDRPMVWVMSRDGSGKRQVLAVTAQHESADGLSWSPDGKRLAVAAFGPETSQIFLVDVARGVAEPFTESPKGALDPAWSPDGSTIAYAVREAGRMDVRLRRLDGSPEVEVTQAGLARAPAWSPDGRRLAYLSAKNGTFELYVVDVAADANGGLMVKNERQLTRDLSVDAVSGVTWGR